MNSLQENDTLKHFWKKKNMQKMLRVKKQGQFYEAKTNLNKFYINQRQSFVNLWLDGCAGPG